MSNYHKTCPVCGGAFITTDGHKKTCSRACEHVLRSRGQKSRTDRVPARCVVCGAVFKKHGNKVTCSSECSSANRTGNTSALLKGKKKLQALRRTQEYPVCKEWVLCSPDGEIYRFKNLSWFVHAHEDFFEEKFLRVTKRRITYAEIYLGRLRPTHRFGVKQWRGWTWGE